jgi:hypothetical protein
VYLCLLGRCSGDAGANTFKRSRGNSGGCKDGNDNLSVHRRVEQKASAGSKNTFLGVPSVGKLVEFKRAALRRGLWFRVLDRAERGVIDLTVKYVGNIRSAKLAGVVVAILDKLKVAMESAVEKMVRVFGRSQARKVSGLAVGWGNRSASSWAEDVGFAWYLAMLQMNTGRSFRV